MIDIYGIKNCDTMKKAFKWLSENNVAYAFRDYKKEGADKVVIEKAITEHGWETVINKRGTTWRKLSDDVKDNMDTEKAVLLALENPSIIKRPLIVREETITVGFNVDNYQKFI